MALIFRPGIWKDSTFTDMPRPIDQFRIPWEWDFQTYKVPLAAGGHTAGHSLNMPRITMGGGVGGTCADSALDDAAMLALVESIQSTIDVINSVGKFEFFVFYSTEGLGTYRKFKNCLPANFSIEMGEQNHAMWAWSGEIICEDPVLYTTGPGL